MFADLLPLYPLVLPFLLVLFRLLGLFAFTPFFSNTNIPGNVRIFLCLAMTFCIWNVVPGIRTTAVFLPESLIAVIVAIAGEMVIGLLMGLMLGAVFSGLQMGAHMISQQMGLSLATLYDPSFEDQSTVIEQVAFWIGLVCFLALGGHRQMIDFLVYSFQTVPLGSGLGNGISADTLMNTAVGSVAASFHAATRIAMPALAAFFIATLTSGLMSRSMPQLNLMTVGIAMHLIVGFTMVGVGLAGWALVSEQSFVEMFAELGRVLSG